MSSVSSSSVSSFTSSKEIVHDVFFNKVLDLQYGDESTDPIRCFWTGETLETRSDCRLVCVRPNTPRGNPEDYVIVSKKVADKLEEEARNQSGKSIPRASLGDWSLRLMLERIARPPLTVKNYFVEGGVDLIMKGLSRFSDILSKETGEHTEMFGKEDIERLSGTGDRIFVRDLDGEDHQIEGNIFGLMSGSDDKIFARDVEQYTSQNPKCTPPLFMTLMERKNN